MSRSRNLGQCMKMNPRHLLLTIGIWGDPEEAVSTRLHRAYLDFKSWCSHKRFLAVNQHFSKKEFLGYSGLKLFSSYHPAYPYPR